ncbi:PQQ-dependent sugar dehydrogenase [Agromyces sp. NBRC 114283]|uniref:PQQ-dependent sugar dehydrogenase n=1 Tax=Agromyces sp. NBRC 114283 TaxID=2994521 RepID=UPI0024A16367|nr:PQQ-dependent sugar dehydrogenase [Agromyces sp. NBRC 114283]GLU89067.1 oxidoreductase [Agromyces sp. NBRC 114283]
MPNRTRRMSGPVAVAALALLAFTACAPGDAAPTSPPPSVPGTPAATSPAPSPPPAPPPVLRPDGSVRELATGLDAPWSVVALPNGAVLVSERDLGRIVELLPGGPTRVVAEVPGVAPGGEGGLLGLAQLPGGGAREASLYAMFTGPEDNRIVRMPVTGEPGAIALGAPQPVLTGIPKAGNHNGGRLAFGPDGFLYATTGDAGLRDAARDRGSLAGKILRMTPDGAPAPGNPFGTHVWSLGHRNPQGIAWDASGRLWAAEFGQNTWDELNLIQPGGDYGWPVVEGVAGDPAFVDPVLQWPTSEASPSGLASAGDALFLAALRGERLWAVAPASAAAPTAEAWFAGEHGRLRDVVAAPGGGLWVLTNNTDGRGDPRAGDDRLLLVGLTG